MIEKTCKHLRLGVSSCFNEKKIEEFDWNRDNQIGLNLSCSERAHISIQFNIDDFRGL